MYALVLTQRPKKPFVVLANDAVASTGGTLESRPVDNRDAAVGVRDEASLLQYARGDRHARAPHAEHQRQELVGQRELVGADAIVRHQQPARAPLFDRMGAVARR